MLDLSSLDILDDKTADLPNGAWRILTIGVDHLDLVGSLRRARASIYLPPSILSGEVERAPLLHVAGYEIWTGVGALLMPWWAERQPVIVNPLTPTGEEAWPGDNAMARGLNLDAALLRTARALPFVDDARVIITGQSTGGLTTLMLAAETFPVAGIAPDVAPLDLGFNARYLQLRHEVATRLPEGSELGPRAEVAMVFEQAKTVLGDDVAAAAWWEHSALGRLEQITCPVSLVMSSADLLVPISQVGDGLVEPHDASTFPPDLVMDPKVLMGPDRPRLLDLLAAGDVAVHQVPVPVTVPEIRMGAQIPPADWFVVDVPDTAATAWNVVVLAEGPTEPWIDHMRFATLSNRNAFFDRCLGTEPISVDQLTVAKLGEQLDRYAGIEWSQTGVKHLDTPEREQSADVLRGLRTFISGGPRHVDQLRVAYAALDPERQVLGSVDEALNLVGVVA